MLFVIKSVIVINEKHRTYVWIRNWDSFTDISVSLHILQPRTKVCAQAIPNLLFSSMASIIDLFYVRYVNKGRESRVAIPEVYVFRC